MSNRVGRALRDHLRIMAQGNTAADAAERIRYREATAQAIREREARFPILTADNAAEAIRWQEARIQELLKAQA